jgi:hypothetical protein
MFSKRAFLRRVAVLGLGCAGASGRGVGGDADAASGVGESFFLTRGAVLVVRDMETYDWPALAKAAGLTTLATHIKPSEIAAFVKTEAGHKFLDACRKHGLEVEHELHALGDLLPRELFDKDKELFRMDAQGQRVRDYNLCVHSQPALEVVADKAAHYTRLLPSTTGRYFYWIDDAMPMCRCPKCRGYSDSDQALIFANHLVRAIRGVDPHARLAHLAYANTLEPPKQIRPEPGIFLEFAPIERRYDLPFSRREAKSQSRDLLHGRMLDALDANLEWFGCDGAQALEYWLDVSRFSGWKREKTVEIPWNEAAFRDDLETYARRGVRHVTTFAAWLDADYARRWGVAPVRAYGAGLGRWKRIDGEAKEQA